ncbi:hypothetical protein EDC14_101421 [Hydrogenispora ethanolica]|uniref:Uncharacterized protein n=1 Tax=Hydrogenispora ethanolica TaxID=1082276 RepID=A0A4R1RM52_HYDET|nr:hypothetical protein EDC14_101421 [Hydrogenispora ethanolica]
MLRNKRPDAKLTPTASDFKEFSTSSQTEIQCWYAIMNSYSLRLGCMVFLTPVPFHGGMGVLMSRNLQILIEKKPLPVRRRKAFLNRIATGFCVLYFCEPDVLVIRENFLIGVFLLPGHSKFLILNFVALPRSKRTSPPPARRIGRLTLKSSPRHPSPSANRSVSPFQNPVLYAIRGPVPATIAPPTNIRRPTRSRS